MSVPRLERSPLRRSGWLELASLASGGLLIWLAYRQSDLSSFHVPEMAIVWFLLGLAAAVWSLRELLSGALGWLNRLLRPWGSRRYHVRFRREAYIYMLILLVTGLGAMLGGSNLLLLVFGLMAGPFVLGGQVTRMVLQRLRVTRRLPEFAVVGERFSVCVRLANHKPLLSAWMIVAADTVSSAREEVQPKVLFARVPPRGQREATYRVCPAHRGRYRFGPMRVVCGFPLGLVERSFGLGETQELLVYPRIGRLSSGWHATMRQGKFSNEQYSNRAGITAEEFHRLREYRGGDNPRAIHWRTTARRNELMVREYQRLRDPDVLLVLDLWLPDRPAPPDLDRVERAVSLAATICAEQARSSGEAHLNLTICGHGVWDSASPWPGQMLRPLLERLALAEAGPGGSLAAALAGAHLAVGEQTRRVLISTRPTRAAVAAGASESPGGDDRTALSAYQVILCTPDELAELISFDDISPVNETAPVEESVRGGMA